MTIVHLLDVPQNGGLIGAIEHENEERRRALVIPKHAVIIYRERGNLGWAPESFSTNPAVLQEAMGYVNDEHQRNPLVNNYRFLGSYDVPTTTLGTCLDTITTLTNVKRNFEMGFRTLIDYLGSSDCPLV